MNSAQLLLFQQELAEIMKLADRLGTKVFGPTHPDRRQHQAAAEQERRSGTDRRRSRK